VAAGAAPGLARSILTLITAPVDAEVGRMRHWGWAGLLFWAACVNLTRPPQLTAGDDALVPDAPGFPVDAAATPKGGDAAEDSPPAPPPGQLLETGRPCLAADQCQSHVCVDGACCATSCTSPCHACNLAGSEGKCVPANEGTDLRGDCARDEAATCQRDGACDGRGGCRLYAATTECAPGGCTGATESSARLCDGSGTCRPPASTRSCAPNVCSGSSCATKCTTSAECQMGFSCTSGACAVTPGRPVLYWALDEVDGTMAVDSSGNGFLGAFGGMAGNPVPSLDVPKMQFADPRSRVFVATSRQTVRLSPLPAALKVANGATVSAWFHATTIDRTGYSEIVSVGDGYILIMGRTQLGIMKRTARSSYPWCPYSTTTHLDGRWHHLVGVASDTGLKTYLDGVERCSTNNGAALAYSDTAELVVGRDPDPTYGYYFDGNIDDVRVYTRVLTPAEIAVLAAGGN
jgi:hypothetical protein